MRQVNREKQKKTEVIETIYFSHNAGAAPLPKLITELQRIYDKVKDDAKWIRVWAKNVDEEGSMGGDLHVNVWGERLETQTEYEARLSHEAFYACQDAYTTIRISGHWSSEAGRTELAELEKLLTPQQLVNLRR